MAPETAGVSHSDINDGGGFNEAGARWPRKLGYSPDGLIRRKGLQ